MTSNSTSALSAENIIKFMSNSLPKGESTKIKDPYAAISLLCHASMLAVGFRLVGLGEDHRIEAQSEPSDVQPLPTEWDASSTYAFRYKHSQSSMEYLIKVNRLGSKAVIMGVGLGDDKTAQCEAKVQDYISEGSLKEISSSNTSDLQSAIKNVFISTGRITDLISLFKLNVIQKLAPGISKEGYEESSTSTTESSSTTTTRRQPPLRPEAPPDRDPLREDQPPPARPYPFDDPLAVPRRSGPVPDFQPPGFEDEFELQRPRRGMYPGGGGGGGSGVGGYEPFGRIGERDLYPPGLGPNDPLRMGPGSGGVRGGGGMHPTFDDPIFGGQQGGQGYDPRAPPGARYDPVGPGDGPPNVRGGPRFPGGGAGGGGGFGRPPNPFGGFGSGDFI